MKTQRGIAEGPLGSRERLLEIATHLLSRHGIEDLTIDLVAAEAGVSFGLAHHYLGNPRDFGIAVMTRAADQLLEATQPPELPNPIDRLSSSLGAFIDYVREHHPGYVSLMRASAAGDPEFARIYRESREVMLERILDVISMEQLGPKGPIDAQLVPVLVDGWAEMFEAVVLDWIARPNGVTRDMLLSKMTQALPAVALRPSVA